MTATDLSHYGKRLMIVPGLWRRVVRAWSLPILVFESYPYPVVVGRRPYPVVSNPPLPVVRYFLCPMISIHPLLAAGNLLYPVIKCLRYTTTVGNLQLPTMESFLQLLVEYLEAKRLKNASQGCTRWDLFLRFGWVEITLLSVESYTRW